MRILIIRPCCIGDVVQATAALAALRQSLPTAHITWAINRWSRAVLEAHPDVDALLDTGEAALPVYTVGGFFRFVRQMRGGRYDLVVSLVRSPLMSAAVALSGAGQRAGLDSNGRGFGYNVRAPIDPQAPMHESDVYLEVVRALGYESTGFRPYLPVSEDTQQAVQQLLRERGIQTPYIVINPAGGKNPGAVLDSKRWPPAQFAELADWLALETGAQIVLLGGPQDAPIIEAFRKCSHTKSQAFIGELTFPQIGALAADALLYVGNDTGLTHIAAASGAKTVMVLGPTDPRRYAPNTPNSLALWKPAALPSTGANAAHNRWDWERDGIRAEEALVQVRAFLAR